MAGLGFELTQNVRTASHNESLRDFILKSLGEAVTPHGPLSVHSLGTAATSVTTQALRFGVWGVIASIADFLFIAVAFVMECTRDVLWYLLVIMAPLACGAYPMFPRILQGVELHAVEISFWFPVLALIDSTTGMVARAYSLRADTLGLYVIALEVIAIVLEHDALDCSSNYAGAMSADLELDPPWSHMQNDSFRWGEIMSRSNFVRPCGSP